MIGRIYRHLQTLVQRGHVVQSPDTERYQVGPRLVSLGRAVCQNFDIAKVAEGTLRELRDKLGHYSVVSQVEADGVRVLATFSGKSDVEIGVKQGSLLAFHVSAQGKVALAYGSDTLCAKVLRSPLKRSTPHTIVNPAALRKEIEIVRKQGWAVAPNETVTHRCSRLDQCPGYKNKPARPPALRAMRQAFNNANRRVRSPSRREGRRR
jgi:DNA-binding IclR family transcriptional regulator